MKLNIEFDITPEEAIQLLDWKRKCDKESEMEHAIRYPFPPGSPAGEAFAEEPVAYYEDAEIPKDWVGLRVDYKNPDEDPNPILLTSYRGYRVFKNTDMTVHIGIIHFSHEVVKEKLKVRKPTERNFTMAG